MNTETLFWAFALFGTLFFVIRSVMIFSGVAADHFGGHHDVYHDTDSASGVAGAFKVLSLHSITAFVMMFGWAGLAALKQFGLNSGGSVCVGFVVGAAFMYLIAYLIRGILKLESEGAVFRIEETVGKTASVYERIPEKGLGRIQLHAGGMIREIQAVSETGTALAPPASVTVVKVVDAQTVAVKLSN